MLNPLSLLVLGGVQYRNGDADTRNELGECKPSRCEQTTFWWLRVCIPSTRDETICSPSSGGNAFITPPPCFHSHSQAVQAAPHPCVSIPVFPFLFCLWVYLCRVEHSGFLAEPCAARGIAVVAVGYSLAPKGEVCCQVGS